MSMLIRMAEEPCISKSTRHDHELYRLFHWRRFPHIVTVVTDLPPNVHSLVEERRFYCLDATMLIDYHNKLEAFVDLVVWWEA